jgi:predicted O-methyltransferase YrrM
MDGVIFLDRHIDMALREAMDDAWESLGLDSPRNGSAPEFFAALSAALSNLTGPNVAHTVKDIFLHIDYLANKAGIPTGSLMRGDAFQAEPQILHDALANISALLRAQANRQAEPSGSGLPAEVDAIIDLAEQQLEGWCLHQKAVAIAEMILEERPAICVEIGIFGGRSLIPAAAALRHNGSGVIYGIEAWDPHAATVNPTHAENDIWWHNVDFPRIKRDFYRFIAEMDLTSQVRVIEATSSRAAALFDTIDYLHIDGSHAMVSAVEDVINYVRKVRPGGIVLFDDVEWETTAPAQALLRQFCEPVRMLGHLDTGRQLCAVMRRRAQG